MNKKRYLILIVLVALLITGCGSAATETPASSTLAPTSTPLPAPTLIPTPAIPLAILVLPADMDQELSDQYQTLVYDLAQSAGMRFQVRNTLTVEDLEPALRVVIILPPDPGLAELAPAAPQAQFLAVNLPDIVAGGNVSLLANTTRPDITAFMAGYIGAMITVDFHTGLIIPKDEPVGQVLRTAFVTGQEYSCGICNPWAGPFYEYPIFVEVPADAPENQYGAYADYLINHTVETMYVYPAFATPDLLTYLASNGILIISNMDPPQEMGNWVASIQPDVIHAIESAWPDLVAGVGGVNVASPLVITNVNEEHLPLGHLQKAQEVLEQLQAGYIFTGVNP